MKIGKEMCLCLVLNFPKENQEICVNTAIGVIAITNRLCRSGRAAWSAPSSSWIMQAP